MRMLTGLVLRSAVIGALALAAAALSASFEIRNDAVTEQSPASAFNPDRDEYLVVWYNDRASGDDVRAQRVSGSGALLGAPFYLATGSEAERRFPAVAYDDHNHQYLVVWEHQLVSEGRSIHGRRVAGDGVVLDTEDLVVRGSGYNLYTPLRPAVDYSSTSHRFLVVWQETWHPSIVYSIEGQLVDPLGSLIGGRFAIDSAAELAVGLTAADLAWNRARDEFLVVWQKEWSDGHIDIHARRASSGGSTLGDLIVVAYLTVPTHHPSVAALPTVGTDGQYLVAFELNYSATDHDISAALVSGTGSAGNYFTVAALTVNEAMPAVGASEENSRYTVAWSQNSPPFVFTGIHSRPVSTAGGLLEAVAPLGGLMAVQPALSARLDGGYLVAYEDTPFDLTTGIFGALGGVILSDEFESGETARWSGRWP